MRSWVLMHLISLCCDFVCQQSKLMRCVAGRLLSLPLARLPLHLLESVFTLNARVYESLRHRQQ